MKFLHVFILLSLLAGTLKAHESKAPEEGRHVAEDAGLLRAINEEYLTTVKPIFRRACLNCHSTQTQYPWYYSIPGIKQWIDSDIREAMKHIDMTNDFPFRGHGSPKKDFEAIRKTIQKNNMPPFRYRMMHWDAGITESEKEIILKWIGKNQQKVRQ